MFEYKPPPPPTWIIYCADDIKVEWVGLLAELPAVLMMHPDRMRAFLGKRRVVDDPDFDRATPRHLRHHLFAHLAEHLLIRPRGNGDKVQELLMLRRNASRIRHHRHRLYAAPALCRRQTCAIIPKRLLSIAMPDLSAPEFRCPLHVFSRSILHRHQM
jgi:hypothetical protein